ncbi:MAG: hypothetical protein U0441_26715 [Polyangiaceae bacterium]
MSATYSTTQIIHSFSFSVNSAGSLSFDNSSGEGFSTMQAYVTKVADGVLADPTIQGLIGSDWQLVWGPVVFSNDTSGASVVADNTMACYYSPSNNLLVIPVAGTNPSSMFDWLSEDFSVRSLVSWSSITGAGSGNVSQGTATGLQILLAMKDGSGNTLPEALNAFLKSSSLTNATVAVAGHSLGGALSPALALYLHDKRSTWDPTGTTAISASPTAGPTPGDSGFASYYEGIISAGGVSYSSLYNNQDVVPLAWAPGDLATIPSIYDANITPVSGAVPADLLTGAVASGLQINAAAAGSFSSNPYAQVSTGRSALTGAFSTTTDTGAKFILSAVTTSLTGTFATYQPYVENLGRFAAQAIYQHTSAYPSLLGIGSFVSEYQSILQKNKPSSAQTTDDLRGAVKRLTGIDPGSAEDRAAAQRRDAKKA